MQSTIVGVIGCGNISDAYFKGSARSDLIQIKACADRVPQAATSKAETYGVAAVAVDALLADPEIEIVLNLTVPLAHATVSREIIDAGKHVYSEKPLAARFDEGQELMRTGTERGLRIGCAPDTFLGASHQACRTAVDEGQIGHVVAGTASMLSHGMEHWHPNPAFFFQPGGGPMLDVGPYYVTELVQLLGPVERVTAQTSIATPTRTVTSEPRSGEVIDVAVPTTVNGVLSFASGANVAITTSWDVWKHRRLPFELYGTEGRMLIPDPNFFGGEPQVSTHDEAWRPLDISAHPFGIANRTLSSGREVADYRIIGLLDMACALRTGRSHRASARSPLA
ncbi:MAG: Gfo/Idh/MocA family oxidoreductase, partial [Pseudomonadota bacterium]